MGSRNWAAFPDWFVNELIGDDCNVGDDPLRPLRTPEPIRQRIGKGLVNQNTILHMQSSVSGPFITDYALGQLGFLTVKNEVPLVTVFGPVALTGVVTVAAARLANTPVQITAPGFSASAALIVNTQTALPRRIRIVSSTNPANVGAWAWASFNNGGDVLDCCAFLNTLVAGVPSSTLPIGTPTTIDPLVGDMVVVETGFATMPDFRMTPNLPQILPGSFPAFQERVLINEVDLGGWANQAFRQLVQHNNQWPAASPPITFRSCDIGRAMGGADNVLGTASCRVSGAGAMQVQHGSVALRGGLVMTNMGVEAGSSRSVFDQDILFDGGGRLTIAGTRAILGTVCMMRIPSPGVGAPPNAGVLVQAGGAAQNRTAFGATSLLYGKSVNTANAGTRAVKTETGGQYVYDIKPTMIGPAPGLDARVAGADFAWAAIPITDTAALSMIRNNAT